MLKNISRLECKVGEKIYQFTCDVDSPLVDVKMAIVEFLKFVGQIEDKVREEQEKAQVEAESKAKEVENDRHAK